MFGLPTLSEEVVILIHVHGPHLLLCGLLVLLPLTLPGSHVFLEE